LSATNGKKKETIEKIKCWLNEENTKYKIIEDPNTYFHLQMENPNLSIYMEKDRIDSIVLATNVYFPDADKKFFSKVEKEKKKFFWNLQSALNLIDIEYSIFPAIGEIEYIYIRKVIYFDGLSKDRLFESISKIARGRNCVILQYQWLSEKEFI
jgi:hypothetical protein